MEEERVVEIWVPATATVGSGYLLADRLVLTSWHVVEDIGPDDPVEVRTLDAQELTPGLIAKLCWPSAEVNTEVIKKEPWRDAALLVIDDPRWSRAMPSAPMRFGKISGQDRLSCWGVGFADAEARPDPEALPGEERDIRDTMTVRGHLEPPQARKSKMLTLHVDEGIVPRRREHGSGWKGSSGTALFCGPLLVGVLSTDRPIATDDNVLGAVPITALAALPGFPETLRAHGIELPFQDASDYRRGEILREYLTAAHRAASDQPYPGVVPGTVPPLAAVYLQQQVTQGWVIAGHGAADDASSSSGVLLSTDEVLAFPETCIVVGGPGGGKSSLVRTWTAELASRLLQDPHDDGTRVWVPVLVQATAVAARLRAGPLPDALAAAVAVQVPGLLPSTPVIADILRTVPMRGARWLVLIDGLDEVAAHDRGPLLQNVAAHAADHPQLYRFIITTRPAPKSELDTLGSEKSSFDLQPFRREDLPAVARDWFAALAVPEPDDVAGTFLEAVRRAGLDGIVGIPLITAMLCQLYAHNPDRPLPGSRGDLYGRLIERLQEHYNDLGPGGLRDQTATEMARCGPAAADAAAQLLNHLINLIAYLAAERWRGSTARAVDIVAADPSADPPAGVSATAWSALLDSSLRRSGLLTPMGDDLVFLHQTFLEYLAARHAARTPETLASALSEVTGRTARYTPGAVDMAPPRRRGRRYWVPPPQAAASYVGFLIDFAQATSLPIERCGILLSQPDMNRTREGADFLIALMETGTRLPDRLRQQTADLLHALAPAYTPALLHSSRLRDGPMHMITEHQDHEARMRVIRGLTELGDQRGADHLYHGARSPQFPSFQEEEARELARLGDPRGADLLASFAHDPGFYHGSRVDAARDLAELGDPRGTDFLFALANDPGLDGHARVDAARDLAQLGDPRGVELLRSFMFGFSGRPAVPRIEPAHKLAELGDPSVADTWYELAAYDVWEQHGMFRVEAARELAKLGDPRTADTWHSIARTGGLHDESRVEAARELAKLGDPRAADTWHALAHDAALDNADRPPESRGSHRHAAARGLTELGDPRAADTWHVLAHDPGLGSGWRVDAARELTELEDPRAPDTWHALAHDRKLHRESRVCAAQELAELSDPRSADLLYARALSADNNDVHREEAARELADLEDPRGLDVLIALASDVGLDDGARVAAGRDLAGFGDSRGADLLLALADDAGLNGDTRVAAAREMAKLRDLRGCDRLRSFALTSISREDFRMEAARELTQLEDPRAAGTWRALARDPGLRDESRLQAARELTSLGAPVAAETWHALARDPGLQEGSRVEAARGLAQADDSRAADTWYDFAHDPGLEDFARGEAAQGLADLGDPRAADTWHALARDISLASRSRVFAARELAQLGEPRAADTWRALADDPGLAGDSRAYAARQLAGLGGLDGNALAGPGEAAAESGGPAPSPSVRPLTEADVRDRLLALPADSAGDVAWAVLGLLAAVDGSLTIGDVAGILNIPVAQIDRGIQPVADLIVHDGHLDIGAETVRRAVTEHLGQAALLTREQALTRWCSELAAAGQRRQDVPDYVVRHGAAALAAAGDGQALFRLVDREWMLLSVARTGSLPAFTSDMLLAAQTAAAQSPPIRLQELRATLAMVTSSDIAAGVPPAALGVLATAGQGKRAMDLAAMVAPAVRSDAYYRIAIALLGTDDADAADAAAADAVAAAASWARDSGTRYMLQSLTRSFHENGRPEWALRALAALQAEAPPGSGDDFDAYLAVGIIADAGDADGAWQAALRIPGPGWRDAAIADFVVGALARADRTQDAISAAQAAGGRSWDLIGDIAAITAENGSAAEVMTVANSIPTEHREAAAVKVCEVWARAGRVDDALTIVQAIDDADRRKNAMRAMASALAETSQADRAISVWTATAPDDRQDYVTADLAKTAAGAGDVDGALQIAAVISDDHRRRTALTSIASAAASAGDLERAGAVVRMIGNQSDEDHAFAEVARHLAASGRFDDALAAIGMISTTRAKAEPQVAVAGSLAEAGDYLRSASLAQRAIATAAAAGPLGNDILHARALMTWARAVALSAGPDQAGTAQRAVSAAERAVAAAQRAISVLGDSYSQELLADALATLSGTLAISDREEEASAAAARAIAAARPEEGKLWEYDRQRGGDRRTGSVAAILAETGPPEQAILAARSLAEDYDRDQALTEVAARLARRGLADQALEASRASPHFTSFQVKDKLRAVARILAEHGHGDGALQAANALEATGAAYLEFDMAELIREAARILAENGWADAAVAAVRSSGPRWNRPAAFADIACAVASSGDIGRAAEIAQTTVGYPALATLAAALSESGKVNDALPLAEDAIRSALAAPPMSPATADALAALERFAGQSGSGQRAGHARKEPDAASIIPADGVTVAAARQALEEASAIADPAERVIAEASGAAMLALMGDPGIKAEATAIARQAVDEARGIADLGDRALALGNAARAFAGAGDPGLTAEVAGECLAAAAKGSLLGAGESAAMLALSALMDIRHVTEALAGIGSLRSDTAKAAAFCALAKRLAEEGSTGDLLRLAQSTGVMDQITDGRERISALTGIGCILVQAGETSLASGLADEAASQASELTDAYGRAVALADQAGLLAALGRCPDAADLAGQALAAAREPVGGWRGPIITKAVEALIMCGRTGDALDAARAAPEDTKAKCIAAAAIALFDAREQDRAIALVSEAFAAVRVDGARSAFYDLSCTQLLQQPGLLGAWLGSDAAMAQASHALAAIEQWWAKAEAESRETICLDPVDADAHNNVGVTLQDAQQPNEAEAEYREAIRLNPSDVTAHTNLGNLLYQAERLVEAEAEYREAIRLNPDHATARNSLGDLLYEAGRPEEAEAVLREAIRLDPGNRIAHTNLGILLYLTDRPTEAEAEYREAIRLDPTHATGHSDLGDVLHEAGRLAEAEAEYREASRLDPDHVYSHTSLGNVLYDAGRLAEAEAEYREAIRLDPGNRIAHTSLGNVLYVMERPAEAEAEYREAIRLDPDHVYSHTSLGNVLYDAGRLAEAEAEYREASRLDPGNATARYGLGNVLRDTARLAAAEAEYREAMRLDPDNAPARCGLGGVLHRMGRLAEAEAEYREAIRLDPEHAYSHTNLGILLHDEERLAEAEAELREAMRLDPDNATARYGLGNLLYQTERLAEAEAVLREAIRLDPASPGAHHGLGNVLYDTDRLAEAEGEYREAIRLDPTYAAAHRGLGGVLCDTDRLAEAEAEFREAIRLDPASSFALRGLGDVLYEAGRLAEAEAEYRQAIRLDPANAGARTSLGNVLYNTDRQAEAEAEYRQAIRVDPANAAAHHGLGNVLTGPERLAEAEAEYRQAIRLDPANAVAHYGLGDVLYEAGRLAKAEAEYREAIRINPRFAEAYRNLARLLRAQGKLREAQKVEDMAARSSATPR